MKNLRERFLLPSISPGGERLRSCSTTLISFCIEWNFRTILFEVVPNNGSAEPFFLHLLKGCVLFESLLKSNPSFPQGQGTSLEILLKRLNDPLFIKNDLRLSFKHPASFLLSLDQADDSIQTAIEFSGKVRNALGHNLGWVNLLEKTRYDQLFRLINSACFHAINCLY